MLYGWMKHILKCMDTHTIAKGELWKCGRVNHSKKNPNYHWKKENYNNHEKYSTTTDELTVYTPKKKKQQPPLYNITEKDFYKHQYKGP